MKVVFDTNVYVSEALFDALAEALLQAGRDGKFYVYVSDYILTEIYNVLLRLETSRRFASLTVQRVKRFAQFVETRGRAFPQLSDVKDHPVLETALNCRADYLVTGDKRFCVVSPYHGILVTPPGDFYSVLKAASLL